MVRSHRKPSVFLGVAALLTCQLTLTSAEAQTPAPGAGGQATVLNVFYPEVWDPHIAGTIGSLAAFSPLYGARVSLYVSLVSVGVGVTLGALIGVLSAFFGGLVDLVVQRAVDSLMAFPAIILALAIVALTGVSLRNVILALIVLLMPAAARVVRAQALAVKEMDYVQAARAAGAGSWRTIFQHMVPNCAAPYIVFATANLGYAVVVEAALSFLGGGDTSRRPLVGGNAIDHRAEVRRGLAVARDLPQRRGESDRLRLQSVG